MRERESDVHIAILETSTNITRQFINQVLSFFWINCLTNRTMILHSCCDLFVPRNEWTRESTRDAHLEIGDGDACTLHSEEGKLIACMFLVNPSIMHATSKCIRPQALDFAPSFKIIHAWGVSRPVGAS